MATTVRGDEGPPYQQAVEGMSFLQPDTATVNVKPHCSQTLLLLLKYQWVHAEQGLMEATHEGTHSRPHHLGDCCKRIIGQPGVHYQTLGVISHTGSHLMYVLAMQWLPSLEGRMKRATAVEKSEKRYLCQPTKVSIGSEEAQGWHTPMILCENMDTLSSYSSSLDPGPQCDHEANKW